MARIEWDIPAIVRWHRCVLISPPSAKFWAVTGRRAELQVLAEFLTVSGINYDDYPAIETLFIFEEEDDKHGISEGMGDGEANRNAGRGN